MDMGTWVLVVVGVLTGVGVIATHASETAVKVINAAAKVRDAWNRFRGKQTPPPVEPDPLPTPDHADQDQDPDPEPDQGDDQARRGE